MESALPFFLKKKDFSDYYGKWIAVSGSTVISSSSSIQKTIREAQANCNSKEYTLAKIPAKNQILIL